LTEPACRLESRHGSLERLLYAVLLCVLCASAQSNPAAQAARQWREGHERAILSEFVDLLSQPNLARDGAGIRKNAAAVSAILERRGVKTRLLEVPGAPPSVFGEIATPGATRTVIFYAHYDGQPLDPKEWATPPWEPVLRDRPLEKDGRVIPLPESGRIDPEWRLYARSASDDKAPIIAIATALDALKSAHISLRQNVKFVFEGEEEAGSPHLAQIIAANKELLRSDVWLICDGPVHQSRRQQIVFGARGIVEVDVTVYGPNHELHSGHYGNWAPNPAFLLARLLSTMREDDGRATVAHFYEGIEPLSETEKRAIAEAPDVDGDLRRELWLGRTEGGGRKLVELLNYPSLNVRGMSSARTGAGASNVIPASATATIDMRLVKGITPEMAAQRLTDHIRAQGYFHRGERAGRADAYAASEGGASGGRGGRLQRLADFDGPADFAARAEDRRLGAGAGGQAANHGRLGATVHDRGHFARADHYRTDRQPRQQSAQLQREHPDSEFVGWDRADGRAAGDVM
jgi:acetylornithine deacetylase/succinyl-diaminopimelate desuccinylase-like protein